MKRHPQYLGLLALLLVLLAAGCAGTDEAARPADTAPAGDGWITLFDGTSLDGWTMTGPGRFTVEPDGSILSHGGMGLFYYAERPFRDYVLELDWKVATDSTNSGVFVRFPEAPDPWYAVNTGYEIQIDDSQDPVHQTGAVYSFAAPSHVASKPAGAWNRYRIEVRGQRYEIYLNGEKVNDFVGSRAREGYIGLQNHDDASQVWFRDIRVRPLPAGDYPERLADLFAVEGDPEPIRVLMVTATHGYRHTPAIDTARAVMQRLEATTEFDFDITEDLAQLTPDNLARYDLLFFANTTLRLDGGRAYAEEQDAAGAPASFTPVTEAQQQAILGFLRAGKGFVGAHAAADAFYEWDAYREMLGGGLFQEHPWTQYVRVAVEEPENPAVAHLGDGFWIRDEIYVLDENPRWNSRVLASLDMQSVGIAQGPADASRNDYPISWIRNYNGGRVFYTKLGHFPDVWTNPAFLQHLLQGMRMAAGRLPADFSGHRVKEVIAEGVWPDDIAVDERGNVWIAELRGKVHRYDAATGETAQIAQLDTTDPTKIEHGLYGIEVDPGFYDGAPYVYLYYAEPETFINTLARYTYRDGRLDLGSRQVLLRVPTEPQCCHQAGDLEWGPDSTLYLSTGDTGMSETRPDWELTEAEIQTFLDRHDLDDYHWSRLVDSERSAQNLQDLRGKILRINRDGSIPHDNPFYGEPGVRWEVYAYGLRNPYRFKVDPQTGVLYIGVVGPDAAYDYDEYNIAAEGGENFGWPRTIGKLFFNEWTPEMIPNYVPPMWEYTYETGGRSATVGPIYRHDGPGGFPAAFQDKVFLFDWSRRWIKWADVETRTFTNDTTASVQRHPERFEIPARRYTNIKTFDQLMMTTPISMELGPDGSLYVAEFDGFWDAGPNARVTRYRWVTGNEKPIGEAVGTPVEGRPLQIRFDGTRSYDPNADRLTFHWSFGDGTTSTDPQPVHTYARPGTYPVRLTVTDAAGLAGEPVRLDLRVGEAVQTAGR